MSNYQNIYDASGFIGFPTKSFNQSERRVNELITYHNENPHLYKAFVKYTFIALRKGYKYFGSQMIIEKIRWEEVIEANNSEFKISNDMAALYSRLFMEEYPTYQGYFRTKKSIADNVIQRMKQI